MSPRVTALVLVGVLAIAAVASLAFAGVVFGAGNPPAPTITSGPANPSNDIDSATFTFTDSQAGVTFLCSLDGTAFAACTTPKSYSGLTQGNHTFKVEAKDSANKISSYTSYAWTVNLTPPAPTIGDKPTNPTTELTAHFTFTDAWAGVTFLCSVDGSPFTVCTSPFNTATLSPGDRKFQVKAQKNGFTSPITEYKWKITNSPPPAPSITAKPANPTNQTSASFSFTDSNASATFLCSLDGAAFTTCASPKTYTGLAAGSHTFKVEAQTSAGTSAATTYTWAIDTAAPSITVAFPANGGLYNAAGWNAGCTPTPAICGSATDPSGVASGEVSVLQTSTGKYWNGTSFTSATEFFNSATAGSQSGTTFSGYYALPLPPDGAYTVRARATDNAGNTTPSGSYVTANFTIDTAPPPPPSITSNPPTLTSSTSASFSFNDAQSPVTLLCKLDAGAYTACTSPRSYTGLANGSHTFSVEAIDTAGNVSSPTSFTWTIGPPPPPTITSNPANPTNQTTASFSFIDAEPGATFLCKLDGSSYAACTSPKSYTGLAPGNHTFYVEAVANSQTSTPTTYTWTIDLTAPPAPSITAKPSNPTNVTSPSFGFTDSESGVTFLCKLDGGSYVACSSPQTYSGLSAGPHTFSVEAKDAAGNISAATSYTWTIDLTPPPAPTITSNPAALTTSTSAGFSFTDAEAGVTYVCQLDIGVFGACTSPKSYSGLADGSHTFTVKAVDAAGNPSAPTSYTWTVDTTPPPAPSLTSNPANPTNQTSASFTFIDSEAGVTFLCSIDNAAFAACTSPKSYAGLAAGSHTFKVEAKDSAGNISAPTSYTWTIDLTPPPAPTITAKPSNPSNVTSPSFSFTDSESGVTFLCKLDGGSYVACSSPQSYSGLSAGSHTLSVEAVDAAGNVGLPTSYTWTIDLTPPPAPTITSNPPALSNSASATFTFTDSEPGVTYVCLLDVGVYGPCATPKSYSGLAQGSHTFSVKAVDAAGNLSTAAASYTWTVDTIPPPKPTITSGPPDPSSTAISTFVFASTPATDVDHYECKIDGSAWTTCTSPYTITVGPTGDDKHDFRVQAVDAAGNDSTEDSWKWKVVATTGQPFTIAGNAVNTLYPGGDASPIDLVFTNPNSSPITVTDATVTVTGTSVPACAAASFTVTQQLNANPVVPANDTKSLSQLGVPQSQWPQLQMLDSGNQDVCATATVNLDYAGNATG